jgi:hypothetical protein
MCNVYCVSYDLTDDPNEYSGLYEVLTGLKHWWHFLHSTWLVVFDGSASDLRDRLEPHLTGSDRILIIAVGLDYDGSLSEDAWAWIDENINASQDKKAQPPADSTVAAPRELTRI